MRLTIIPHPRRLQLWKPEATHMLLGRVENVVGLGKSFASEVVEEEGYVVEAGRMLPFI